MAEPRPVGNNSGWSLDAADDRLWEIEELIQGARGDLNQAAARGKELQDLLLVAWVSEARVALAEVLVRMGQARRRVEDARKGEFAGEAEISPRAGG